MKKTFLGALILPLALVWASPLVQAAGAIRPGDICGKIAEKYDVIATTACIPVADGLFYDQDALWMCRTLADRGVATGSMRLVTMAVGCLTKAKNTQFEVKQLKPCVESLKKDNNTIALACMMRMGTSATREVLLPGLKPTELPSNAAHPQELDKKDDAPPVPLPVTNPDKKPEANGAGGKE